MPSAFMEVRPFGLGELISTRRYLQVPDHQRD